MASTGGWASEEADSDSGRDETRQGPIPDGAGKVRPFEPPVNTWDSHSPLLSYAERFSEPALADTGGASSGARIRALVLPLRAGIPGTAASALKVMDFVRAVVVDPFTVWAPCNNWAPIEAVLDCLLDESLTAEKLLDVVNRKDVTDMRLLRGVVACLSPVLRAEAESRRLLAEVLLSIMETGGDYDDIVSDEPAVDSNSSSMPMDTDSSDADSKGEEVVYTKTAMSLAHQSQVFTAEQYTRTWLLPPATPDAYAAAHGLPAGCAENYQETGVWAPGLPVLRTLPGFVGVASAQTDASSCQHDMGKQKSHTGGTFGGYCTCSHPKCLGVVVLDQSESQRMPIEFVVQRFATLPDIIVYDFACAALKTALVRLPYVVKTVAMRVDRFHWRKNHTLRSKAMSPDAYSSMDGTNTSSSAERNAVSRRQQRHLRQMKQDAFNGRGRCTWDLWSGERVGRRVLREFLEF